MIAQSIIESVLSQPFFGAWPKIDGVSIDTRSLQPSELYVAIRGERFDGHDYVQQAHAAGAVAAMVDHAIDDAPLPLLIVDDTVAAMAEMAKQHRASMQAKVVAITGSCGKTTTRALTESILQRAGNTLASVGSFNNHIGVPLTLLKLRPEHEFAVQEVGMNNPGEIAALAQVVQPNVAVVTMAAPVHLEGLKTLEGIANEKGSLYPRLQAGGVAIINADDQFCGLWQDLAQGYQQVQFSTHKTADVYASAIDTQSGRLTFTLHINDQSCLVRLQVLGRHNVVNALAAASIAHALGVDIKTIQQGLEAAEPEKRRLITQPGLSGSQVIDDSYNANPVAMQAAIDLLKSYDKRRILVFADMGELGDEAAHYHRQVGEFAKQHSIDALYCYGDLSRLTAQAFGEHGYFFDDKAALIERLTQELDDSALVLIKGSNAMQMNEVAQAITEED